MKGQPSLAPVTANKLFELYRWGGRFTDHDRASQATKRRIEAHEAQFEMINAPRVARQRRIQRAVLPKPRSSKSAPDIQDVTPNKAAPPLT